MTVGGSATIDEKLRAALPKPVRERVRALRLVDGVATLVLDVADLDRADRERLEADSVAALTVLADVADARVALMADRAADAGAGTRHITGSANTNRRILAIGSGKGGVGKSTLSANLAIALARLGRRVGLVDADILGPSQPRLFGSEGQRPEAHDNRMIPIPGRWGVPMLSMGHLIEPGKAIAWRGPMASGALAQLIEAHWGDPDNGGAELLLIDLPPGTGDVQLTMLQKFTPAGAIVVSTPQDLALIDARRAIDQFRQMRVPIVGLVENMAGYVCPHCGEASDPFGHGGAERAAAELDIPFLGAIPLTLGIRRQSDAGSPPAAGDDADARAFGAIAARVVAWLDETAGQDGS